MGHSVELIPPGGGEDADHTADTYTCDLFGLAGNLREVKHGATLHPATSESGWILYPDNLTFDPKRRMFVATDGANDFGLPDGICGIDAKGPARGPAQVVVHLCARCRGRRAML
jgi:secreted PhoX family phosphatase